MVLNLSPAKFLKYFLILISLLLIANLIGLYVRLNTESEEIYRLIGVVDFDEENSLPTLFSFLNLLVSAVFLLLITSRYRGTLKDWLPWGGLAIVFLFLSLDEILSIHEQLIIIFREKYNLSGLFYFSWVIPYGIGLIILVLVYLPFLFKLPKWATLMFIGSGLIFVAGAIGMELLGGKHYETNGNSLDITYGLYYTIEELLEMLGITLFNYTLLRYLSVYFKSIQINLEE